MLKNKTNEIVAKLVVFSNNLVDTLKDEKGEDPDGGITKWLLTLGVSAAIIFGVYKFLEAFFPNFLNGIFTKIQGFFG